MITSRAGCYGLVVRWCMCAHAVTTRPRAGVPHTVARRPGCAPRQSRISLVRAIHNGGANQFELKRILGHAQLATTDGYMDYAQQHLAEQHKRFSPLARVNERRTAAASKPKKRRPS